MTTATSDGQPFAPATPLFNPPQRRLSTDIARYLRDAIVSGRHAPGERLAPAALAQQLGMSAMPVREALVALANEGLVDGLPRRGFRVARLRLRDIEDSFDVYAHVAGLLMDAAARTISATTIASLAEMQAAIERQARVKRITAARSSAIEELNFEFHRTINYVPDAPRLRWFLRAAARHIPRQFYESIPGWTDATLADHPAILEALRVHDAVVARRLMENHVHGAGKLVIANLVKHGFWQSEPEPSPHVTVPGLRGQSRVLRPGS